MLTSTEALVVGASIVGAFQVYVSLRLLSSPAYAGGQKLRQVLLVWLLPFFGAVIVYLFMQNDIAPPSVRDTAFTASAGGSPEGIGSGSEHA
jgi:hypothetical protein